jgi:hypothetical protein
MLKQLTISTPQVKVTGIVRLGPKAFPDRSMNLAMSLAPETRMGSKGRHRTPATLRFVRPLQQRHRDLSRSRNADCKATLDEGHGFSRAVKPPRFTASAAEVRLVCRFQSTRRESGRPNKI